MEISEHGEYSLSKPSQKTSFLLRIVGARPRTIFLLTLILSKQVILEMAEEVDPDRQSDRRSTTTIVPRMKHDTKPGQLELIDLATD